MLDVKLFASAIVLERLVETKTHWFVPASVSVDKTLFAVIIPLVSANDTFEIFSHVLLLFFCLMSMSFFTQVSLCDLKTVFKDAVELTIFLDDIDYSVHTKKTAYACRLSDLKSAIHIVLGL